MPAMSETAVDNNDKCSTGNGTGVFIPQCILDGSALSNPAIFNRPQRKRRGSGHTTQSDTKHSSSKQSQKQQQQQHNSQQHSSPQTSTAAASSSSGAAAAKNPFAATPRNIRQQQLLCNLSAAADCFSDVAAGPAAAAAQLPPTPSRGPSLDLGLTAAAAAYGSSNRRMSVDFSGSNNRTSLESSYYQRPSIDVSLTANSV